MCTTANGLRIIHTFSEEVFPITPQLCQQSAERGHTARTTTVYSNNFSKPGDCELRQHGVVPMHTGLLRADCEFTLTCTAAEMPSMACSVATAQALQSNGRANLYKIQRTCCFSSLPQF